MSRSTLIMLFALVALMAVSAGTILAQDASTETGVEGEGTAVIWDDDALSDAITYSMTGVTPPGDGMEYVGWLVSDSAKLNTGPMTVEPDGSISHDFDHDSNRYTGQNLVRNYNAVVITEEVAGSDPDAPAGRVVFSHVVPMAAMEHIRHLLTNWPPDAEAGILTNLNEQLALAIQHADLAKNSTTIDNVHLHLHHVINIIEGVGGPNYDISFGDPGDGEGILLHAADRKHGGLAAGTLPDDADEATVAAYAPIIEHAAIVDRWGQNVEDWTIMARDAALNALDGDTRKSIDLFLGPGGGTVISLLDGALNGVPTDPQGGGGAKQAYLEAQRMATYTLQAVEPDTSEIASPAGVQPTATATPAPTATPVPPTPTPVPPTPTPVPPTPTPVPPTPTPTPTPEAPATGDDAIPALAQLALLVSVLLLSAGGLLAVNARRSRKQS